MFKSGKNIDELVEIMNHEMEKVIIWLNVNKLSLNLKKTHFMIFSRSRRKIKPSIQLMINNVKIDRVISTKFLGVMIDEHLTFTQHIQYIKGKISRGLGILYKAKRLLNKKALITLYYSFIYPYFSYCISVWGSAFPTHLFKLEKLQKRVIRLINGAKWDAHTLPLFRKLNLLNLKEIYIYQVQFFV